MLRVPRRKDSKTKVYTVRITKKRIRSADRYLSGIDEGERFFVGLSNLQNFRNKLNRAGFPENLQEGGQILPAVIGPITRFNANGSYISLKDLPKETVYRQMTITGWHKKQYIVDIPYERYQREIIPAPNIELMLRLNNENELILLAPQLRKDDRNTEAIVHTINLLLEIFGECEIFNDELIPIFNVPVTKLNWNVLPTGSYPWQTLRTHLTGLIRGERESQRGLVQSRLEKLASFNPNFVAVGTAGFRGYLVFGFENRNFFILESISMGNATYVLGENWEQIAQRTKEEIVSQDLLLRRIIHNNNWSQQIDDLF